MATGATNTVKKLLVMLILVTKNLAELSEDERIRARVRITSPPLIIREPDVEVAYKDDYEVTLPCQASGDPHPEYYWTKDGDRLDLEAMEITIRPGDGFITIAQPKAEHEGIYQCYANNKYGTALSVRTLLKQAKLVPFETLTDPTVHTPLIGSYLKLECTPPYRYPPGITYWGESKPGAKFKVIETDKRVSLDYSGNLHIANVVTGDSLSGIEYVCIVQNQVLRGLVAGDYQKIRPIRKSLMVRIKPRLRWNSESPTIAVTTTEKKMKCIFSGYPTPDILWSMSYGSALASKVIVSENGHEITIPNVEYSDEGFYKCVASNSKADAPNILPYKVIQLTVQSMPIWIREPESVDRSKEENAEFHCEAGGVPPPTISWSINGEDIMSVPNSRRHVLDNGKLVKYTNITELDAAVLQCNATNDHGYIFLNAYLNVFDKQPTFISKPAAAVKVAVGQDTNLTCEVYGAPKPKVTWKKGEELIRGNRFQVNTKGKIVGNLTIQHALKEDAGIYICTSENKNGKIDAEGQLIVREKTEIVVFPESQTVVAGEQVVLDCQAITDVAESSKLTITWLKNGDEINFSNTKDSLSINTKNYSLIISDAAVDDSSTYTCVADNRLDRDESSAQVIVKDKPDAPFDIIVETCRTQSSEVAWTPGRENNDEVTEFIVYYNTSFDDKGVFHEGARVSKSVDSAKIKLSPWANYTFCVKAKNSLGLSERSPITWAVCLTPPMRPFENPKGVCTESCAPDELVIVWNPMPKIKHNGDNFHYIVTYERQDVPEPGPISEIVNEWEKSELVLGNQGTFHKYKISVQAGNVRGTAAGYLQERWGYSGEKNPEVKLTGFTPVQDSVKATSAHFMWNQVDENDPLINGFFKGYRIVYWKANDPDNKRQQDIIINEFDPCPVVERSERKKQGGTETGEVHDLWPYSEIKAGVLVLNGCKTGVMSDVISFNTPEGLPGYASNVKVVETGSYHIKMEWSPPLLPNGVVIGYTVGFKKLGTLETEKTDDVGGLVHSRKILKLKPETEYSLTVAAKTGAGIGLSYMVKGKTLVAMTPDKPRFGRMDRGENSVNVTIDPSDGDTTNPGSEFYIKYKKDDPVTKPITTSGWFIGMMCAIIFLLLILLIICLIRRNRGGKLKGRNPEEEENFNKQDEPKSVVPTNVDDDVDDYEKPLDVSR